MAAGSFNIQKASGGVLKLTPADGAGNTSLVIPESGTVTTNEYVNSNNLGNGSTTFNGFGGTGFKNYIINGGFNIDQYNRGIQSNWNNTGCYTDRFLVTNSSSVVRNGAGANNPIGTGLYNHLSITKTAGADTQIGQRWEIPKDKAKQFLNGRTLTFSCWVLAGTANFVEHLFFIKNGISANSYEVKAFNITKNNVASMWTRVTGTITNIQWTYEAGDYIEIRLDLANAVAGELHTTGWQLEEGSVATQFEHRPYGLELSLCQRYYQRVRQRIIESRAAGEYASSSTTLPVTMRVSPSYVLTTTYASGNIASNVVPVAGSNNFSRQCTATSAGVIDSDLEYSLSAEL